ncbi:MAG: AAA family ATPase [Eubacterium sp.]
MNKIITIGREFGSGGRTIAKMTAEKLNIPCYDSELLTKIAEDSGFDKNFVEENGENTSLNSVIAKGLSGWNGYANKSADDYLWQSQKKVILDIANKESCIIVGRCADFILKEKADCLSVFIHADMEKRAKRIVSVYGESDESPEKRLKDKDKRRSAFYYYHTDMKWGDVHNYHVALDSGVLGFEKCVDIITALYKN